MWQLKQLTKFVVCTSSLASLMLPGNELIRNATFTTWLLCCLQEYYDSPVSLELLRRCVGSDACLKAIQQQLVVNTGGTVLLQCNPTAQPTHIWPSSCYIIIQQSIVLYIANHVACMLRLQCMHALCARHLIKISIIRSIATRSTCLQQLICHRMHS
jgi:hypothetical protein